MKRLLITLAAVAWAVALVTETSAAIGKDCRYKSASNASGMYKFVAKQFDRCGKAVAGGSTCSTSLRDAKVASKLSKARAAVIAKCGQFEVASVGFSSPSALAIGVSGAANGEGRQVCDSVRGREPGALSDADATCASRIVGQAARAGSFMIKTLIRCGNFCSGAQADVDEAWADASQKILDKCSAGSLTMLVGGDLAGHLDDMRAGAQRVVNAMLPKPAPVVSVVSPTPGGIITPPGVPFDVDVAARVVNVPHAGYVNSFEVVGVEAAYDAIANEFERTVTVSSPGGTNLSFPLKARTTLGTVSSTANANLNLGSLAPDVVITSPVSGAIFPASPVTISGQVIGDLSEADILLVGGSFTSFNPTTGAFSTSVALGPESVHIVEASVESLGLGTTNRDSVVVLKGTALPLSQRVPDANHNRLNNSGFVAVTGLIQSMLEPAFDPSAYIGQPAAGGTVCGFSTGTKGANIFAAGANTVEADISIDDFHIAVCDVDTGVLGITCDATYDADNVTIVTQADLVGQLQASPTNTQVTFTGGEATLGGNIICDFVDLFLADLEGDMEQQLGDQLEAELPNAFNEALGGINVSGPIGEALDVEIDAVYADIPEDSSGVTFIVDSNVIALDPIPDAPAITHTLVPSGVSPPVLGPNIPGGGPPYDLGFCLSDGFVNRAMTAFMMQGMFNINLTTIDVAGIPFPLSTNLLSGFTGDPAYDNACDNCPVTLVLKPTAAPVSRAPQVGEDGTVVLIVPNYEINIVADDGGTPTTLLTATVVFELPITLNATGNELEPVVGTLAVNNVKVIDNPIGANEATLASTAADLFPLAAESLGGLFGAIPLPPFEGLTLNGVGSGYNVSCTGIYMSLS